MNDEIYKSDDPLMDQMLERLLDGQSIEVTDNNKANHVVSQLQQLMHSFIPHEHDFNSQDLVGKKWGDMQVQQVIGEGGMGVVYLAQDAVLNRSVALKVLNGFALNYMDSESFVNEAKLMAQVRHPHIMAVYGAGIHDDIAGYWGELLTGETVEEYLKEHAPLSERSLNDLCTQLAEAVQAIHHKGLVHGDIKSNNVVIEAGRGAVLMDFGTSFDLNDATSVWFRPSTPLAMAPEQFNGEKPTQASDIFSLGVLFHLLITGQYPFSGKTYEALKADVLSGRRNQVEKHGFSKAYDALIDQMLCHDPKDSPNAQEVIVALQRIRQLPLQKAKNRVFAISSLALLAVTAFSLFLVYTTKQAAKKLSFANTQTEAVNDILTDIIVSPSIIKSGKDVTVKDMVESKLAEVRANTELSGLARNRIYRAFSKSFASFGDIDKQAELLQEIIDSRDSDPMHLKYALIDLAKIKSASHESTEIEKLLAYAKTIQLENTVQQIKSEIEWHDTYARFYHDQQEIKKAYDHSQNSMALWKKTEISFDASVSYNILGNILLDLSRFDEAKKAFQQCIEIAERFEAAENLNVFGCKSNLSNTMAQLGEFDNAIELTEQMLPTANIFLGDNSAELFVLRMNYSATLGHAGYLEKSMLIQQQLLEDSQNFKIPAFYASFVKGNLAYIYIQLEQYDQAEMLLETAIVELTELISAKNEYTLNNINNLAEVYYKTNRAEKAIALLTEKIPISEASFGNEHRTTLAMKATLAWSHHLLGNHNKASELIHSVYEISVNIFGKEHDFSVEVLQQKQAIEQAIQATVN